MDSSITAAGRALRGGDPLGALKRVALRDDPSALALRGFAMAQLGDLGRARELLRPAARSFGPRATVERARVTAEAERDLAWPPRALSEALRTFAADGDRENATHARLLQIRAPLAARPDRRGGRRVRDARRRPGPARGRRGPVTFEIAFRRGRAELAREALARAREAASSVGYRGAVRGGRAGWTDPRPAAGASRRRGRGALTDPGRGRGGARLEGSGR